MTDQSPGKQARVEQLIDANRHQPGPLLPILHEIQAALGHIPESAVPAIARALNLTRAEVHGVISFYHDFRTRPGGRHRLQVCCAEACQARGSRGLAKHVQHRLGTGFHQTTADGEISLEPVYCLGCCATGPNIRLDDRVHGRVSPERLDSILDDLARVPLRIITPDEETLIDD